MQQNPREDKNASEKEVLTRRGLLHEGGKIIVSGILGGAIVHAIHLLLSETDVERKERALEKLINAIEDSLRNGDGARILRDGTPQEKRELLFSPGSPLRQFTYDALKGTKYDPSSPRACRLFPSAQIGIKVVSADSLDDFPATERRLGVVVRDNANPREIHNELGEGYGGCLVLSKNQVLTNAHVAEMFKGIAGVHSHPHPDRGIDLAIVDLPQYAEIQEEVAALFPKWEFSDKKESLGYFSVMAGIDPDAAAHEGGIKVVGGFMVGVEAIIGAVSMEQGNAFANGAAGKYVFVGPLSGQTIPHSLTRKVMPQDISVVTVRFPPYAFGLSGSAVLSPTRSPRHVAGLTTLASWMAYSGDQFQPTCCREIMIATPALHYNTLEASYAWGGN